MFITGGGSTAMGAMLKGVFGFVFEESPSKARVGTCERGS